MEKYFKEKDIIKAIHDAQYDYEGDYDDRSTYGVITDILDRIKKLPFNVSNSGHLINKEDALSLAYWHGDNYTIDNPYPDGVEAVDVSDLENLPEVDSVMQWVPCSVRTPNESDSYLVSGKWSSGKVAVGECEYSSEDGYFQTAWNFDVLAWMPKPAAYKGEKND